jgi:hypothetical protein
VRLGALALAISLTVLPSCGGSTVSYPLHTDITATMFWIGEPQGDGSSEDNAVSAWDDDWLEHYGGVDDPHTVRIAANDFFPVAFTPRENPFYADLPYDDFHDGGRPRGNRTSVVPWASDYEAELAAATRRGDPFSLLKNRWIRLVHAGRVCYAQWEDSGPYVYDDARYVFGADDPRPANHLAHDAGIDVSPAVRDCLGFVGLNNDENKVDWQFVSDEDVPDGPWKRVVTTRQVHWREPGAATGS